MTSESGTTAQPARHGLNRRDFLRLSAMGSATAVVFAACSGGSSTPANGPTTAGAARVPFPDSERVRVQHLLRRAGFAPSESEVQAALALGRDKLVDALLNPAAGTDGLPAELRTLTVSDATKPEDLVLWWLRRMTTTQQPAVEKLTFFWHGLHTSGLDKLGVRGVGSLYNQNVFQRQTAYGRFADILKGISRQPAMMIYLDLQTSVAAHPNENFARELMELFSMGPGNYSEDDVRAAARAFTGYSIDRPSQGYVFRPVLHDNGSKTFLGQTGNLSGDDVIDIILKQPATPKFLAGKLWSFFAYDNPDEATLAPLVQAFNASSGDVRAMLKALFTHPAFYSDTAYRAQIKSPLDLAVGAARQLGLAGTAPLLGRWLRALGHVPFNPPNVAGWPGGPAWLTSGSLLSRANTVSSLLAPARGAGATAQLDVDRYLQTYNLTTAGQLVDHFLLLMADGQVTPESHAAIVDYVSGSQGASLSLGGLSGAERARRVQGGLYLIMAGPEYQLA
ncbi:MAG TPA: DUF1800 domain-containing protein [Dehalococcoidia bacterium]|nr:DUF1800 domain-containing protein [Dehalococcoidia bacterium]